MSSLITTPVDEAVSLAETSTAERHATFDRLDREAKSLRTDAERYEASVGAVVADLRTRGGEWREIAKATKQKWRQVEHDERKNRWGPGLKSTRTAITTCEPPEDPVTLPVLEIDSLEAHIKRLNDLACVLEATESSIESQHRAIRDDAVTLRKSCAELLHE